MRKRWNSQPRKEGLTREHWQSRRGRQEGCQASEVRSQTLTDLGTQTQPTYCPLPAARQAVCEQTGPKSLSPHLSSLPACSAPRSLHTLVTTAWEQSPLGLQGCWQRSERMQGEQLAKCLSSESGGQGYGVTSEHLGCGAEL